MTIYVVRHAKAGSRSRWEGPDDARPLSKSGIRQTTLLTQALRDCSPSRVLTSPYVRCVQTVQPLAEALGISMDLSDALAEGAPRSESVALLEKYAGDDTVLCTHGDVIGDLLDECRQRGVALPDARLEKASTWVLEFAAGQIVGARYVPPPQ